jgi:peptidoglycan/LPS O-acetylase OafA/YrhL
VALLAVETEASDAAELLEAALRRSLRARGIAPEGAVKNMQIPALPRTDTGKIRRVALREAHLTAEAQAVSAPSYDASPDAARDADWGDRLAARGQALIAQLRPARPAPPPGVGAAQVAFDRHFPGRAPDDAATFVDLGGDSLTYLSMALDLEAALGALPERWERLSPAEIDRRATTAPSAFLRLDMATFLRGLAIFLVVSGHFRFIEYGGGAALFLLVIAGYNFATFQMPELAAGVGPAPILRLIVRVAAPVLAYLALLHFSGVIPIATEAFLLHSNFISPNMGGGYWYVEVYVQIMLLLAIAFAFAAPRRALTRNPFRFAMIFALGSIALYAAGQAIWDTHYLYRRLPHALLWLFAIGVAVHFADRTSRRMLVTGAAALGIVAFAEGMPEPGFIPLGLLLLIWVPSFATPGWIKRPVQTVAGASLFIYLTHFQMRSAIEKIAEPGPGLAVILAVIGGVILWRIYDTAVTRAAALLSFRSVASSKKKHVA